MCPLAKIKITRFMQDVKEEKCTKRTICRSKTYNWEWFLVTWTSKLVKKRQAWIKQSRRPEMISFDPERNSIIIQKSCMAYERLPILMPFPHIFLYPFQVYQITRWSNTDHKLIPIILASGFLSNISSLNLGCICALLTNNLNVIILEVS